MKFEKTDIEGLIVINPLKIEDERGYFFESFRKTRFEEIIGSSIAFLQENESCSKVGTIRGLHFQNPPFAQGKLVRVPKGRVLDVVVDIRKGSPTYGKHFSIELSSENAKQLWIPEGFAHGFAALEEGSILSYKCTDVYNKESEGSLLWSDPEIGIDWNIEDPIVSEKDQISPNLSEFETKFI
jgi:dTDP-4-dehydrorhamnose 3,5-epimerase